MLKEKQCEKNANTHMYEKYGMKVSVVGVDACINHIYNFVCI